jgi:hypothetical protein
VTGTTVLGLKYKDGVMIACDTLGASRDETRSRPRSRSENHCLSTSAALVLGKTTLNEKRRKTLFFFSRASRAAVSRRRSVKTPFRVDTKPNRDVARVF